jgi:cytochrome P450
MTAAPQSCPVTTDYRFTGVGDVLGGFRRFDALQDQHRVWRVEEPRGSYWMVLDRELAVQGLQDHATFSSAAITPLDPEPALRMIPIQLDPPEHGTWRRLLAGYFSPRRTRELAPRIEARVGELLDELAPRGGCDYVHDFAFRFPTVIFLEIVGLPVEELPAFVTWVTGALHADEHGVLDRARQTAVMRQVMGRMAQVLAERRAAPDPAATDIISHALGWEVDGRPVTDPELLSCLLLLFLAGLDTVANALSMATYHLATTPADRAALAARPHTAPAAVEELLRAFTITQLARKVTRDTEFGGQQLRAGEMVVFSLAAADRDPAAVDRAREVVLDRDPVPHYAFGAGAHRCLGSHLAREEMQTALRMWHERIPDYELATDAPVREYRSSVYGVIDLPLRWPVRPG